MKNTYSFSRLNSFDECYQMFDYNYVQGERGEANFFNEMGSLAHLVLELYDRGKIADPAKAFATGYKKRVRPHEVDWHETWYMQTFLFFLNWKGHKEDSVWIEEHNVIDYGGFKFQGYVDRMYKDEGFVIQDYKISKPFTKKDIAKKSRQLYLYSSFVKERFGEFPTDLSFFFFRLNKKINIKFNKRDYEEAVEWMHRTVELIELGVKTESKDGCDYFCESVCSFRNICEIKYG